MVDTNTTIHIYLSPHLDDVALSCGGRICQQVRAGDHVVVVTVFAAAPGPDAQLSPFARELHERWGGSAQVVQARQQEDRRALSILGAEPLHWPYADCIYRRTPGGDFLYAGEGALWGEIHPSEAAMVTELAERIRALSSQLGGTLYAPLAVGGHVDHRIVRRAAERAERPLTCYEDYPYAEDPGAMDAVLTGGTWRAELVALSQGALETKIAAIARYRSQISTFWGSTTAMATALRAFAERTGDGGPAERYWRPKRWWRPKRQRRPIPP